MRDSPSLLPAFRLLLPQPVLFFFILTSAVFVFFMLTSPAFPFVTIVAIKRRLSGRFFFFFIHCCCREEELAVKSLSWGALRRFQWRATPLSTVEGASSPSTVEVSVVTMSFSSLLPELGWSDRVVCWSISRDECVYGSTWSLSFLRINSIRKKLWTNLIRKMLKKLTDQVDP